MRFASYALRRRTAAFTAVLAVCFLNGCSEDPGLQERVNRLQAEMQEKERQLQEAQSALEKTRSELKAARAAKPTGAAPVKPGSPPPTLAREQLEESYAAASQAMQKQVGEELRNYSVENCTQYPVVMPTDERPYHSKIGLAVRSDRGRTYRLEFPVSADATGKWTFPATADVADALADDRQQEDTASSVGGSSPAPSAVPAKPPLVPGQTATETRVIEWGGDHPSNTPRPTRTPSGSNAPAGQAPTPPIPSNRDVTIHW